MKISYKYSTSTFANLPDKKRSLIVSVMIREFALNGYRQASLNNIAKDCGISKGSLYQYFHSKEEMFLYVFQQFTSLVKSSLPNSDENLFTGKKGFWQVVKGVLQAGVRFIDCHPEYFKLYLRVLFEHDLPKREELIASVRLFSKEYFLPLVQQARKEAIIRQDVSANMVVFAIDAMLDRFLQGYAKPYLDGGLGLAKLDKGALAVVSDEILLIIKGGVANCG